MMPRKVAYDLLTSIHHGGLMPMTPADRTTMLEAASYLQAWIDLTMGTLAADWEDPRYDSRAQLRRDRSADSPETD